MKNNTTITAQLSLYPFDSEDILKSIYKFIQIFRNEGLKCEINSLSSLIQGDRKTFFKVLPKAYAEAEKEGRFAMVVTLSNATAEPF